MDKKQVSRIRGKDLSQPSLKVLEIQPGTYHVTSLSISTYSAFCLQFNSGDGRGESVFLLSDY